MTQQQPVDANAVIGHLQQQVADQALQLAVAKARITDLEQALAAVPAAESANDD